MLSYFNENSSRRTMVYWKDNQNPQPWNNRKALSLWFWALFEFQGLGVWLSTQYTMAPVIYFYSVVTALLYIIRYIMTMIICYDEGSS